MKITFNQADLTEMVSMYLDTHTQFEFGTIAVSIASGQLVVGLDEEPVSTPEVGLIQEATTELEQPKKEPVRRKRRTKAEMEAEAAAAQAEQESTPELPELDLENETPDEVVDEITEQLDEVVEETATTMDEASTEIDEQIEATLDEPTPENDNLFDLNKPLFG